MLQVQNLSKRYGEKTAVNDVSFTVPDGKVTGFLGPNGAGKSTTMRMIVGLDRPTAGTALVDGSQYTSLKSPLGSVGALLEGKTHPGRSAYNHLRSIAYTHNIPLARVHEVIEMTGLNAVAKRKVGGFSLGMGQRLGIAVALLGNPHNVILDEPVNGLDPEGVVWVRQLAKHLASEGRAVLISSHLMSEMAQTADDLIIIGRGRLLEHTSLSELLSRVGGHRVLVRTDERERYVQLLNHYSIQHTPVDTDGLLVSADARALAELAFNEHILLSTLAPQEASLEDVYLEITRSEVEYASTAVAGSGPVNSQQPVAMDPTGGAPQAPYTAPEMGQQFVQQQPQYTQAPANTPWSSAPANGNGAENIGRE